MRKPRFRSNALAALLAAVVFATPALAQPAVDPTDLDMDGEPGLAVPPAVEEPPIPSALVGVGSVLVDHSHQNDFFVNGFTDYLASQGWTITQHFAGRITPTLLEGYDILIVPTRSSAGVTTPFTVAEISAIQAFLANGEGLWMLSDGQNSDGLNTLSTQFGVVFQNDAVRDSTNNEGIPLWPTISVIAPHATTDGVTRFGYYLGDCVIASSPAVSIARADDDAYSVFCPAGTFPTALAVWENVGRAVFCGDGTPLHPTYYPGSLDAEEELLLQNIANWLLGDPPNAASLASWGSLKGRYAPGDE